MEACDWAHTISNERSGPYLSAKKGIAAAYLFSRNEHDHDAILKSLAQHPIAILHVTSERLQSLTFHQSVHYNRPWLVVVNEAHCILNRGCTSRHSHQKNKAFTKTLKRKPTSLHLLLLPHLSISSEFATLLKMKNPIYFSHSLYQKLVNWTMDMTCLLYKIALKILVLNLSVFLRLFTLH